MREWRFCSGGPRSGHAAGTDPPEACTGAAGRAGARRPGWQAAEAKPISAQAEFIGRAAAVDKVELRARIRASSARACFTTATTSRKARLCSPSSPSRSRRRFARRSPSAMPPRRALANADVQLQRAGRSSAHQPGTRPDLRATSVSESSCRPRPLSKTRGAAARRPDQYLVPPRSSRRSTAGIGRAAASPGKSVSADRGCWRPWSRTNPIACCSRHPARAARGAARRGHRRIRLAGRAAQARDGSI